MDNQIYAKYWEKNKLVKVMADIVAKKIYASRHWLGIIDQSDVLHAKHLQKNNWFEVTTNVSEVSFTDELIGVIRNSNLYFIDPTLKFVQVHIASNISKISIYDRENLLAIGYDPNLIHKVIHQLINPMGRERSNILY